MLRVSDLFKYAERIKNENSYGRKKLPGGYEIDLYEKENLQCAISSPNQLAPIMKIEQRSTEQSVCVFMSSETGSIDYSKKIKLDESDLFTKLGENFAEHPFFEDALCAILLAKV